jgi:hypothetical protein
MEIHPYIIKAGLQQQLNLTAENIYNGDYKIGGVWFSDSISIVCGTFPPRKEYFNRKGYIHYSSSKNKFWQHIDSIYMVKLYANKSISDKVNLRIENSLKKIEFLRTKRIGFIDVFTKVSRKNLDSWKDDDIIEPYETIFDNDTFDEILKSSVENIIFVYSKSYNVFMHFLRFRFPNISVSLIRQYKHDNIPLRVERFSIGSRTMYLSYSPIHGNNEDVYRRLALQKAIDRDFI